MPEIPLWKGEHCSWVILPNKIIIREHKTGKAISIHKKEFSAALVHLGIVKVAITQYEDPLDSDLNGDDSTLVSS
jgi:hypothetical protein